ncbi:GNAT family N-acetyltransferase [Gordonia jinhuaensis]|uniref:N-acetyltransferase n=1 Tax=Gordonia jinhuaensis TaxID=1517702 RepID=A0A916WT69_9ACTN|nr:GNAT family N-acetyltransferase [Gordonia jinhuaensis]GGB27416.1 N-acetyltransferase [Gordonia jinhuaensis]
MTITIRPASASDSAEIAAIYRYYVDNTVITFDYESPDAHAWQVKMAGIHDAARPFLTAADENGTVVGFAYLAPFRAKQAYDWTVEDTIYLHPDHRGHGTGRRLLAALLTSASVDTVRRIIAVIAVTEETAASIALHTRLGFTDSGTLSRVGFKHDRWVDCRMLEYSLDPVDGADAPPTG